MSIVALLFAWAIGGSTVALLWPRERSVRADLMLIAPLGVIVGLFATSVLFFAVSLSSAHPAKIAGAIELVAMVFLLWRVGRRWRMEKRIPSQAFTVLELLLTLVLVQVAAVASVVAWRSFVAEPLGGWDGWAIWNMHARFMLRAGPQWPELLSAPQLNWTHPDYPRLVSASVARLWAWAGREDPQLSAVISVLFAAATVGLLVGVIRQTRGRVVACASGIVLLTTPFLVTFAANQHADIPLASLMLGAVVLVLFANQIGGTNGAWTLAGICAGGASWTKNEGLLFASVLAAVVAIHLARAKLPRAAIQFGAALFVAALPVIYFKAQLAPANDLMASSMSARFDQLWDGARHATILSSLGRDLGRFGEWTMGPWVVLGLPLIAWRTRRIPGPGEWMVPAVIGLMLLGYYLVYLTSPHELRWHLDSSLVRLLLQLWPMIILVWALRIPRVPAAVEHLPQAEGRGWKRGLFVAVNLGLAGAIIGGLARQRAANELAVRGFGGRQVSVALGEGWYPLERHGRNEWAWSSGRAQLAVNVSGNSARTLTLRFTLGASGARRVSIRQGATELWSGAVSDQHVPVTITGLSLVPGANFIEFTTDVAGISEAPAAGGRALAFAIFNLTVE